MESKESPTPSAEKNRDEFTDAPPEVSPSAPPCEIEVDCDPTVSYASQQNAIELIHSITIANRTKDPMREVEVIITPDPPFAEALRRQYEVLMPGEVRTLRQLDFKMSRQFLANHTEAEKGTLKVEVKAQGESQGVVDAPIEVLAFDQWGGTRSVPELICAFSTPNHPHIDTVMADAGALLTEARGDYSLNGYNDKNRESVQVQVQAIYAALARRGILYSMPPAGFTRDGQKIRQADRILQGGVGTCLDLTMLLVSCLEQANLNPLVLVKEGHAWVGVWLVDTSFSTCLSDDVLAVRKRIDAGEMLAIETTALTQAARLGRALDAGYRHFSEEPEKFEYAIDVRRARLERIVPLPSRDAAPLEDRPLEEGPQIFDTMPPLPPLIGDSVLVDDDPIVETPDGRLGRWTSKLLDLTLSNRLLNFKATNSMIQLMVPDPAFLEDAIADGKDWKIKPMPTIGEGADPRSNVIARSRTGEDPVKQMAQDALSKHELLGKISNEKLDKNLYNIYLDVKNRLEETGSNCLFLAIGFLRWAEDEKAERTYLAPLLLVPVTLKRTSVRTGFYIQRHDDETIVNPTLLTALKEKHGVTVKGLDPPPTDDKGVDVTAILSIFREAVKEIPRWEVVDETYLGIFSFSKFVMYMDLKNRQEALRKSRVVTHLMDRPDEALDRDDLRPVKDLDDECPPGALMAPLSADSSQLNALRRADQGRDFVMEGPPGTGKSQTITNLITHFLGKGKRVLFVSEKMAALGVVERRLNEVGLGPFCLQLHSAKANKREVLEQMQQTMEVASVQSPVAWEREVDHLTRLRNDLNGVVHALHQEHENGLTVRGAIDVAIAHREWPAIPVALSTVNQLGAREIDGLRETGRQMQAIAQDLGDIAAHPLRLIRHQSWSHGWEGQLLSGGVQLVSAIKPVRQRHAALTKPLGLSTGDPSPYAMESMDKLAEALMQAPSVPEGIASQADSKVARKQLAELRQHGEARNEIWGGIEATTKPEITRLNAVELQDAWAIASSKWFLPRWFAQRAVKTRFLPYMVSGKRPPTESVAGLLESLVKLGEEDAALAKAKAIATTLLEDAYQDEKTDWGKIALAESWATRLSLILDRFSDAEDLLARDNLAKRVQALTGTRRELLAPGGAMAQALQAYRSAYKEYQSAHRAVAELSSNDNPSGVDDRNSFTMSLLEGSVGKWTECKPQIRSWCHWNKLKADATAAGLAEAIGAVEDGRVSGTSMAEFFDFTYQVWWLKDVMDRDNTLSSFNSAVHDQKILDFQAADERFQELTKKMVYAKLAGQISMSEEGGAPKTEMAVLNREVTKKRAHIPIRKLVQSIPTLLPTLKPCLLMSPMSVAQYLDPSVPQFDLVLFDEASQIPVWDAVGVIARGKQVIVVGDNKQLPPTNFFDGGGSEEEFDNASESLPKDLESILDECMACGMAKLSLDWHYRSAHESLIAFSNHRYYESRLITFPSPVTQDTAVKLVQVNGLYERGGSTTNRKEADAVVDRICEHFNQDDEAARAQTMGVVTFNTNQMRLIDKLLNTRLGKSAELESRIAAHGAEKLFIKNLENVQGDERDIILFSTTFGKDAAGRTSLNFGPLNKEGGERRLNVAVTRARRAIEIFSSLRPEDIDLSRTRSAGVADLKSYLNYALKGPSALVMESTPTGREPDSPFEREVIDVLRNAGWQVHPQVGCSGYRIDIGVVDRHAPGSYICGVECDGATYHSLATARDRDRLRQMVLERLGWTLARVWSTDWWLNKDQCARKLVARVEKAQADADEARALATADEPDESADGVVESSEGA